MHGRRHKSIAMLVGYFLLLGALAYYFGFLNPILQHINPGLDLAGGVHIVLEAEDRPDSPVTDESMDMALEVIRRRVDALGVAEPVLQRVGSNRIAVDLPGANPGEAREVIGRTAILEFKDPDGNLIVTGGHLTRARAVFDELNRPVVMLEFGGEGVALMEEATRRMAANREAMHMYLDGELIMDPPPIVQSTIPNGQAEITGMGSIEAAQSTAVLLSHGSLPVHLNIVAEHSVSALLGEEAIAQSQQAALYGIIAVAALMLVFYRAPGFMATAALALYLLLTVGILTVINATLTLPGIAGIILSVGMAVDANVLIFERIKEELSLGKSLRTAIDSGFKNAFSAIIDANVTTLLAAAVLGLWGSGPVRGFAVTLAVGVLASMFTALTVTGFLLRHLVGTRLFKGGRALFGAGAEQEVPAP